MLKEFIVHLCIPEISSWFEWLQNHNIRKRTCIENCVINQFSTLVTRNVTSMFVILASAFYVNIRHELAFEFSLLPFLSLFVFISLNLFTGTFLCREGKPRRDSSAVGRLHEKLTS